MGISRLSDFLHRAGVDPGPPCRSAENIALQRKAARRVPVGRTLEDGDELDGLRIIHTPGHSPGHMCIGVGNVLLSADHILARTLPHQWLESAAAYTGLGHYLESLDKIARMPGFELALAAHEQVIHDVYRRIETIRSAHRRRLERLLGIGPRGRPAACRSTKSSWRRIPR